MKNYTQVYVKNSFEAAEMYCEAFGAEITFEMKNDDKSAYAHCELSVDGEGFLALSEAANLARPGAEGSRETIRQSAPVTQGRRRSRFLQES